MEVPLGEWCTSAAREQTLIDGQLVSVDRFSEEMAVHDGSVVVQIEVVTDRLDGLLRR